MLIVDLGNAGAQSEAGLADKTLLPALFTGQTLVIKQQREAINEGQPLIRADLFQLGLQGGSHATEFELAQLRHGLCCHDCFS
jgi:hypothetical protein